MSWFTLTRLAALELWTSFRLLAALAALLSSGGVALIVSELSAERPRSSLVAASTPAGAWYAIALAIGLAAAAAVIAGAVSADRIRGFSGWLVSRTAPRAAVAAAWFGVGAVIVAVGGGFSGLIAWLALVSHGLAAPEQSGAFLAAMAACLAAGVAGIGLGLLVGCLLRPLAATLIAALLVGTWLVAATILLATEAAPGGGFVTLATFHHGQASVADSFRSAGLSLAAAAGVLVVALAAFGWVDL